MIDKFNKKMWICLLSIIILINLGLVSADWGYGSLHQHTEYSSVPGGCPKETLSWDGYTVAELKEQAGDMGLSWLAFSDHSYCLNSAEFNTKGDDEK